MNCYFIHIGTSKYCNYVGVNLLLSAQVLFRCWVCSCSKGKRDHSTAERRFRTGDACWGGWSRDFAAGLLARARAAGRPFASSQRQPLGTVLPWLPGQLLPFCNISVGLLKRGTKPAALKMELTPAPREREPARWLWGSPAQPPLPPLCP